MTAVKPVHVALNRDDFIILGAVVTLVAAAVALRHRDPAMRWSAASLGFVVLTALAMLATGPPQSIWANVPVVGGATVGAFAGAEVFARRLLLALIASVVAGFLGLVAGMIVAVELGLLIP